MFLHKFFFFQGETFSSRRKQGKLNFTLRLKFMQIQHKLFLIVCYEKCFARALIEDFSPARLQCGMRMVKLAFRFIKRRIFSFMIQKSQNLSGPENFHSFFNFQKQLLHRKPDIWKKKKEFKDSMACLKRVSSKMGIMEIFEMFSTVFESRSRNNSFEMKTCYLAIRLLHLSQNGFQIKILTWFFSSSFTDFSHRRLD